MRADGADGSLIVGLSFYPTWREKRNEEALGPEQAKEKRVERKTREENESADGGTHLLGCV